MADYTTIDNVKTYLGITSAGDDALIGQCVNAASEWLDIETRRILYADADTTEYVDYSNEHIDGLTLHVFSLGDLSSITTLTNGDGTIITSAQYTTYPKTLTSLKNTYHRIKLLGSSGVVWTYADDWENAISIEGRWSYYNALPDRLDHMTKRLAAYAYRQKDSQVFDTIAIPDAGVITIPAGFPADVGRWVRENKRPIVH